MNGFYRFLTELQEFTFFNIDIFRGSLSFIKYRDDTLREMYLIGTKAFWVVVFGGLFVGIILATETVIPWKNLVQQQLLVELYYLE